MPEAGLIVGIDPPGRRRAAPRRRALGPGCAARRMLVGGLLALVLPAAAAAERPAGLPPNVVIILADDLGWGDLGCYGHPSIRTPHLDRMAAEGIRFTDFYSAGEVCTPSRAALLTGRYPVRSGMCHDRFRVLRATSTGHLPDGEVTLAEALRGRGYATACIGKWHLGAFGNEPAGHPARHGFDRFFGLPHSNDMDALPAAPPGAPGRADQDPSWWNAPLWRDEAVVERPVDQTTLTARSIDEAIAFVGEQRARPFFLYLPLSFPHVPLFASEAFRGTSPRGLYGDVVEELDAGVGRLLAALRAAGLDRDTLVVFTSDNGPWLTMQAQGGSAGTLREGKGSTWEGGMRVPAIAWWPGRIRPGRVHRGVATTMDLFTTACRLAGAAPPADRPVDGVDLAPVLLAEGEEEPEGVERAAFFYYRGRRLFAVRSGRHKAHFLTQAAYGEQTPRPHDPPLLFDLAADPSERFDRAAERPDEVARLTALARAHLASCAPAPSQLEATTDAPPPAAAVVPAAVARRLPPPAPPLADLVAALDAPRAAAWAAVPARLEAIRRRIAATAFPDDAVRVEVEVFPKAVEWALECGEWWEAVHLERAAWALDEAERRLDALAAGSPAWRAGEAVALAHRSRLDGSPQPYGIVVPPGLDRSRPAPVWIWLHGRGERDTDLHFLWGKSRRSGEFFPADAVVLHPFGRYCNGWKGPGEVDVFEALEALAGVIPVDRDRVVLAGFSMGGAGAWGIGARHADRFCAVHGGAGFVDTARFIGLAPLEVPPWESRLWRLTDVPPVARNLLGIPAVAYSGERDWQRPASEIMAAALAAEGRPIPHVIGAGMEHRYDDASRAAVAGILAPAVAAGRPRSPDTVHWAGTTLADGGLWWVEPLGLGEHCAPARIDAVRARREGRVTLDVDTVNVTALALADIEGPWRIDVDGTVLEGEGQEGPLVVARGGLAPDGAWGIVAPGALPPLRKRPGLTGPIDTVFDAPFVVVGPTGPGLAPESDRFAEREFEHLARRWHDLFRGPLPVVAAGEVTDALLREKNLVLFGDARSNPLVARVLPGLPLEWTADGVVIGPGSAAPRRFPAGHVPVMAYPNPLLPPEATPRLVVLNSGLTFREEHDANNALQNRRLPDWAVIDPAVPPDGREPGRVVAADFFDEGWAVKRAE